jgi:hypothetical protein
MPTSILFDLVNIDAKDEICPWRRCTKHLMRRACFLLRAPVARHARRERPVGHWEPER